MIISSKFKDYYDTISKHGVDKTVVFNRELLKEPLAKKYENRLFFNSIQLENYTNRVYLECTLLGFCGKIYPCVKVVSNKTNDSYFYTFDSLSKHIYSLGLNWNSPKSRYFCYGNTENSVKSFLNGNYSNLIDIFQLKKVPIFSIYKNMFDLEIEFNSNLNKHEFFKIKDAFTTYQDIYMYISGVLTNTEKPIVKISDKDMQISKGHYGKYSFKKPPGKGKWR